MLNPDMDFIYDKKLGLEGNIRDLVNRSYRDDSYSDDALIEISRLAEVYGLGQRDIQIPLLVLAGRNRYELNDGSLPYEDLKLDKYIYGNIIPYEANKEYGEIEIREEDGRVLISIYGVDDGGEFSAAGIVSIDEFMSGDKDFLEQVVGSMLSYCIVRDDSSFYHDIKKKPSVSHNQKSNGR